MRACREAVIRIFTTLRAKRGGARPSGTPLRACLMLGTMIAALSTGAQAADNYNRNTFGEIGLLEMPSAHMAPDGRLAFSFGDVQKKQHYTLAFQALPWFEAAFRYSHFLPGQQNYDRSFSAKLRLFNEDEDFADVVIGTRDLLGTGIYSSEYVAASRHFGPLDVSLGMGWGRLANTGELRNPLTLISSKFNNRAGTVETGGVVNFGQFFRGRRAGLFGGVMWETPIEGLNLLAEYSSDRYVRETSEDTRFFRVRSPVNLGLSYRISSVLQMGAGWYYGSTYGLTLTLNGNLKDEVSSAQRLGPAVPPSILRSDEQQRQAIAALANRNTPAAYWTPPSEAERATINLRQALLSIPQGVREVEIKGATLMVDAVPGRDTQAQCAAYARIASATGTAARSLALSDLDGDGRVVFCPVTASAPVSATTRAREFERKLRKSLAEQNLILQAVAAQRGELWLYYQNSTYLHEAQAVGRAVRVLMRDAAPDIELFHLVPVVNGLPLREITVTRSGMERLTPDANSGAVLEQMVIQEPAPRRNPVLDRASARRYPDFYWGFAPRLGNQLFDPDNPLQSMIYGDGWVGVSLAPGLSLDAEATSTLWSNYRLTRPPDSVLPHVRTDLLRYLDQGANGISFLGVNYVSRLTPELFAWVKAGYLEDMFMGAGGNILWRPEGSRFAIGVDAYQVWQRDYDRLFGVRPYKVATGHVSLYYESPWYGMNFVVRGGRYLAGDWGATFEIKRRFDSGVEIGAFATFTNVPFSKFGEGSFDKGIMIRLPLEWMLPIFTQASYDLNLRPLTRDGGARLSGDDPLFEFTRRTSYNEINRRLGAIAEP